ncbi:hypothetical protein JMJ35_006581 [Cladonia borealis]|uniref:Uncharacterized protein n=1 Tax=Cladonia borealis TaxID=184061 RepID=A0AA39QZA6_9LECA|nr:hypothetical protein JMJ35_006581 [Cladonia borealis]
MPRKIRRTKGRRLTEERYEFNKDLNRPRRHHIPIATKILATDHYFKGSTAKEVSKELEIPVSSVKQIATRARQRAEENRRPLKDISNYQRASGSGRKKVVSSNQADAIAKFVVSSRECRMKTAEEHVADMELQISVSTFQNLIIARFHFALRYRHFNWRNVLFTDEASIRGLEVRGYVRGWGLVDEKYHKDMILGKGDCYSMGMIWGAFGHGVRGPVHFYRTETEEEKQERAHQLDVENAEEQPNVWLAYMATEALKLNPDTGKRRGGKAASINNFAKKRLKTRGDRSRGGVD